MNPISQAFQRMQDEFQTGPNLGSPGSGFGLPANAGQTDVPELQALLLTSGELDSNNYYKGTLVAWHQCPVNTNDLTQDSANGIITPIRLYTDQAITPGIPRFVFGTVVGMTFNAPTAADNGLQLYAGILGGNSLSVVQVDAAEGVDIDDIVLPGTGCVYPGKVQRTVAKGNPTTCDRFLGLDPCWIVNCGWSLDSTVRAKQPLRKNERYIGVLAGYYAQSSETPKPIYVIKSEEPRKLYRLKLTADLQHSDTATAVILTWDGSAWQEGHEVTVEEILNNFIIPSGSYIYGTFCPDSGNFEAVMPAVRASIQGFKLYDDLSPSTHSALADPVDLTGYRGLEVTDRITIYDELELFPDLKKDDQCWCTWNDVANSYSIIAAKIAGQPSRGTLYRDVANELTQTGNTKTELVWYAQDCKGGITQAANTLLIDKAGEYMVQLDLEVFVYNAYSGFTVELYANGLGGTKLADAYVRTTSGISFAVGFNRTCTLAATDFIDVWLKNDDVSEDVRWTGQLSVFRLK